MTIADLKIMIQNLPDDLEVYVEMTGGGFISSCIEESGMAQDYEGNEIFVMMGCYCEIEDSCDELIDEILKDDPIEQAIINTKHPENN